MDQREIKWNSIDWINLAQRWAFVMKVMNLCVLQNVGIFLSTCEIGGFSRRTQLSYLYVSLRNDRFIRPNGVQQKTDTEYRMAIFSKENLRHTLNRKMEEMKGG
jgi:hypothetical protein